MSKSSTWFRISSVLAFAAMISFFQIDTAWADEHNFNGWLGWKGIGAVLSLVSAGAMWISAKNSNT
jgi:hypothetical protein